MKFVESFVFALVVGVAVAAPPMPDRKCKLPISNFESKRLRGFFPKVWKTYDVPMSDGVRLHTNVLSPFGSSKSSWPVIIDRSPYGGLHTELLADIFLLYDFVAIGQDMRGTCKSEGNFSNFHSDQKDGNETINWILQQSWCDGNVYEIGASADGIAGLELALASPKKLKAQFIIFATGEAEETFYPGGAFRYALIEKWLNGTVPKQADRVISSVRAHEGPGKYWDEVELVGGNFTSRKFNRVKWPTVMWAGWYDIFNHGNLVTFDGIQHESDPSVQGKHYLVVDPLGHCQSGSSMFPHNLIEGRSLLPVLLGISLMKGDLPTKVPEGVEKVTFYVMGSYDAKAGDGNYWTSLPDWPSKTITPLYLHGDGSASYQPPSTAAVAEKQTYTYDPKDPVPTIGGNNLEIECGPIDQTPKLGRKDVLVFTSSPLTEATALTGELTASLYVSTSNANDTDFTVSLMDVYPDDGSKFSGQSILIQDGIRRMRWRESRTSAGPEGIVPNKVYKISVSLWNTSYVFSPGHKIRVAVSSSNAPRFEPNSNTGLPLRTSSSKTIVTDNTIYHSKMYPSAFNLPIVALSDLPKHNVLETEQQMLKNLELDEKMSSTKEKETILRSRMMKMLHNLQGRFNTEIGKSNIANQ